MKHLTASQARESWFQLLDEVAGGEVVCLEHNGKRLVLRTEETRTEEETDAKDSALPDYSTLLKVDNADEADLWDWD